MKKRLNNREQLKKIQERLAEKFGYRYQAVFASVFYPYCEMLCLTGAIPSLNTKRLKSNPGSIKGQIKASRSDFIADVEIAVRETLSPSQQKIFSNMINMQFIPETTKYFVIEEVMGAEFKRRGIYPTKSYFQATHAIPRRGK